MLDRRTFRLSLVAFMAAALLLVPSISSAQSPGQPVGEASEAVAAGQLTQYVGNFLSGQPGTIYSSTWKGTSGFALRLDNTASFGGPCLNAHQWLRVRYLNQAGSQISFNDLPRGSCGGIVGLGLSGVYAKAQCKIMVDAGYANTTRQGYCFTDW